MEFLNIAIFPLFVNGILSLALHVTIWLFLVMAFFKVSLWKAVLIALIQGIVAFVLTTLAVLTLIGTLIGSIILVK